jgi:hypothetical protein
MSGLPSVSHHPARVWDVGRDPEAEYFQTVEEFFVSRRGDPLFLSSADWLLVRRWRRAEIPLRVVLRGIADALDSHAHSFSRDRKVRSLQYCAAEVDAAAERWRRALASGAEDAPRPRETLDAVARALEAASSLGPAGRRTALKITSELRQQQAGSSLAEQSAWLASAERRLVRALLQDAGAEAVTRLEAEIEAMLAPYAARMPERVLAQIREESRARRLLESHGLPRLSLFHGTASADAT